LQQDEIAFPPEVGGHLNEDFPIESLLVEANTAPIRNVPKDLIGDGIDRALRLSGSGASSDKPAADEIFH
jgi:hypothetical protein